MPYLCRYDSPLGPMLLAADEAGVTGAWFEGQKHFAARLGPGSAEGDSPALAGARRWLDLYFAGWEPGFMPPLHLTGTAFQLAVKNTVVFTGVAVPLAVVLSLVLALMLECRIPLKSQFRTFFLSPMVVPIASIILVWQVLFHSNGVVNEFLTTFGVDKIDWLKSDFCKVVIVVLFEWKNLGYFMILFMAALNNIPRSLLEVADVEGASAVHKFFKIKLRYLSPTVLFVTILAIINSFKVFREIYLLTGNYPYTGLYMMQHFMNNMFRDLDYQRLSAAAVILALGMVVLIAILFAVENWFGKDVEG